MFPFKDAKSQKKIAFSDSGLNIFSIGDLLDKSKYEEINYLLQSKKLYISKGTVESFYSYNDKLSFEFNDKIEILKVIVSVDLECRIKSISIFYNDPEKSVYKNLSNEFGSPNIGNSFIKNIQRNRYYFWTTLDSKLILSMYDWDLYTFEGKVVSSIFIDRILDASNGTNDRIFFGSYNENRKDSIW
jgi:hypothetical protein